MTTTARFYAEMPKNGELRLAAALRFLHARLNNRLQGLRSRP
jgi:hypothetical protein